ncbi:volume-regulated anion channel subunit LRRC8D-like isoform X2 [Watersipora subatra]|uniref:volume-regulated anion channel subunit LRRC8D-like isoform X2 n=1 Tax=Watersipora subatra TaxID=2589382 RepID=UPI00355C6A6F
MRDREKEYRIRWRRAGMSEEQYLEFKTDGSPIDYKKGQGQLIIYMEIEKNIPPEVFDMNLSELKQLKLMFIESSHHLQQLLEKVKPKTLTIVNGNFSNGIPAFPTSLVNLNMIRCKMRVKKGVSKLTSLTKLHLESSEFKSDESLGHLLMAADSLTDLHVTDCENARLPKSLRHLQQLVNLNLYSSHLSSENEETLSVLHELENLGELILCECKLPLVPESVMQLPKLTKLILTQNKLLGQTIPDKFDRLVSLRELSLGTCYLSEIPISLGQLKHLESLDLSANHLSATDALKPVESLTSLTCLSLSQCSLDALPKMEGLRSLQKLELAHNNFSTAVTQEDDTSGDALKGIPKSVSELDISGNNFSGGLPEIVANLTGLISLKISASSLSQFPESILTLSDLKVLDLSRNAFPEVPASIEQLKKLESLNMAHCLKLVSIINLSRLKFLNTLSIENCRSLSSPPLEVCRRGLKVIQQFFSENVRH